MPAEPRLARFWGVLAGLSGAAAVAIAAWASHGLAQTLPAEQLPQALARAHAANQQHLIHSLALLGVAIWSRFQPSFWLNFAGLLFVGGIVLFAFGIYVLHLWWPALGHGTLRLIVPGGGIAFILGWLAIAIASLRRPPRS